MIKECMAMDIDDSPRLMQYECEARACAIDDNDEDLDM